MSTKNIRLIFLLGLFSHSSSFASAQSSGEIIDSCTLQISLLTCGPGKQLYSIFGHSALRLTDPAKDFDIIFNYGTFDFAQPDFYFKFLKGRLDYFLSVADYTDFLSLYQAEGRSMIEQQLQLFCSERVAIKRFLDSNLLAGNRFYKYDFINDNCTTRIRNLLFAIIEGKYVKGLTSPKTTSRNLLHSYLEQSGRPWSKLGIDILVGSSADRYLTAHEAMFLPEMLLKGLDSTIRENQRPLVTAKWAALKDNSKEYSKNSLQPLFIFTLLSIFGFVIYTASFKQKSSWAKVVDFVLFFISGLTGIIILFMWVATDHVLTKANYNIVWAMPLNLGAACVLRYIYRWRLYFWYLSVSNGTLLVAWPWLPQSLNISLFPLVVLLFFRSLSVAIGRHKVV